MTIRKRIASGMAVFASLVSACGIANTNAGGYIVGDGQITQYPESQRGSAAELSGRLLKAGEFDPQSVAGRVTVLNVWGAWCGACRAEAPLLQDVHEHYGARVSFVGIDIRDTSPATAIAYERSFGISYPSIYSSDGKALQGIPRNKLPGTIPATIVLDTQGRVAAVVRGAVESKTTLIEVVDCVIDPTKPYCTGAPQAL